MAKAAVRRSGMRRDSRGRFSASGSVRTRRAPVTPRRAAAATVARAGTQQQTAVALRLSPRAVRANRAVLRHTNTAYRRMDQIRPTMARSHNAYLRGNPRAGKRYLVRAAKINRAAARSNYRVARAGVRIARGAHWNGLSRSIQTSALS